MPLSCYFGTLAGGLGCSPLDQGAYPPQSVSQPSSSGIRSLTGFGGNPPTPISALPPLLSLAEVAPTRVSGRTSYLQARLAFHPYPQIIRGHFTVHRCGPPVGSTPPSSCPWVARLASGLPHLTIRPLRTRFPCGYALPGLTSPSTTTRGHINQKARRHPFTEAPTSCR